MTEIAPPLTKHEQLFTASNTIAMQIMASLDDYRQRKNSEIYDHSVNNWASQVHHPCLKHLVHKRVDWAEEALPDIDSLYRFEEGNDSENLIKEKLMKVGFTIDEGQRRIFIPEYHISGKIDGMIPIPDVIELPPESGNIISVPVEIKSVGPHFWESTKTVKDLLSHPKFWIQGIPSQLNLYLHATNLPFGFLILKTFGKRWRILPMMFDEELLQLDLMKARKVNEHVAAGTYPEPIPYDSSICGLCGFLDIKQCHPLRATGHIEVTDGEAAELGLYCDLKEEYKNIKKHYDYWHAQLIGNEKKPGRYYGQVAIQDDIEISTQIQNRKRVIEEKKEEFDIVKESYMEPYELIITKIDRIL